MRGWREVTGSSRSSERLGPTPPAVRAGHPCLRPSAPPPRQLSSFCVLSLPLRFWVNILRNPHFIFDVHVTEVVDASLHVIAQTFMDACTKTEHKLSRVRAHQQTCSSSTSLASSALSHTGLFSRRSLLATSCSMQKRFPRTRRWWTSESLRQEVVSIV